MSERSKGPTPGPSQAAVGRALGLSPAAVTKLKRQGMPVDSVGAAQAWRQANIRPYLRFDMSPPRTAEHRPKTSPGKAPPATDPRVLAIEQLRLAAEKDFTQHEVLLRLALTGLPRNLRGAVCLSFELWDKLSGGDLLAGVGEEASDVLFDVACGSRTETGAKP